jgi:hypothetical protein
MIPKPEVGDYHRFRVSIGLLLMAVGPIVFWFVLKESYDLFRTSAEIDRLTPLARWMVYARQSLAAVALLFSAAVGVWLFFIGFDMFRDGDRKWRELQDIHDEILILERDEKKAGQQSQSVQEIDEATQEDIEPTVYVSTEYEDSDETQSLLQSDPDHRGALIAYRMTMSSFINIVRTIQEEKYLVLTNQKIRSLPYDIVLRARDHSTMDILIELKIWRSGLVLERVRDLISRYSVGNVAYEDSLGRKARTLLIFAVDPNQLEDQVSIAEAILDAMDRRMGLSVIFISEEHLANMDEERARKLVENPNVISFRVED